jgi:hypothetical protein
MIPWQIPSRSDIRRDLEWVECELRSVRWRGDRLRGRSRPLVDVLGRCLSSVRCEGRSRSRWSQSRLW